MDTTSAQRWTYHPRLKKASNQTRSMPLVVFLSRVLANLPWSQHDTLLYTILVVYHIFISLHCLISTLSDAFHELFGFHTGKFHLYLLVRVSYIRAFARTGLDGHGRAILVLWYGPWEAGKTGLEFIGTGLLAFEFLRFLVHTRRRGLDVDWFSEYSAFLIAWLQVGMMLVPRFTLRVSPRLAGRVEQYHLNRWLGFQTARCDALLGTHVLFPHSSHHQ